MYKVRQIELEKLDMLPKQSRILRLIHTLGKEATPTKISLNLFRRRHSISEHLSRMEEKGLVRRIKDLQKKNLVRIELTEKGLKSYKQGERLESIVELMSELSFQELEQMELILKKLRDISLKTLATDIAPIGTVNKPQPQAKTSEN